MASPSESAAIVASESATVASEAAATTEVKLEAATTEVKVEAASMPPTIHSFTSINEETSITTTTTTKDSSIDNSKTFLRLPNPEQHRDTDSTCTKLLEAFDAALSKTQEAGRILKDCQKEEQPVSAEICSLKTDDQCLEERKEYKESCKELEENKKHVKEALERVLNAYLKEIEKERLICEKEHNDTVREMNERHSAEVKELSTNLRKLQLEATEATELKEMKQLYQQRQEEVESLRARLGEKEKALNQLREEIEVRESQVKMQQMMVGKERMEEQLKMFSQIEDMVSRLPDIDCEKIEPLVKDIAAAMEEMKGKAGNKRAVSWRE